MYIPHLIILNMSQLVSMLLLHKLIKYSDLQYVRRPPVANSTCSSLPATWAGRFRQVFSTRAAPKCLVSISCV